MAFSSKLGPFGILVGVLLQPEMPVLVREGAQARMTEMLRPTLHVLQFRHEDLQPIDAQETMLISPTSDRRLFTVA